MSETDARAARLAAALRENLKRRKARGRAADEQAPATDSDHASRQSPGDPD